MATEQGFESSRSASVSTSDESRSSIFSSGSSTQSSIDDNSISQQAQQKIQSIFKSTQDSISQLYQLYQVGAVRNVHTQDGGCNGQQCKFTVGVEINSLEPCFVSTMVATSKKKAKKLAATKVLDCVKSKLESNHSLILIRPLSSTTSKLLDRGLPTKAQAAAMAEDRHHRELLNEMASLRTVAGHNVGVLSIDLEQYDQDHSITLEIGISFMRMSDVWSPIGITSQHFIIHDREHLVNGRFCIDNRDNFMHGQSQRIAEVETQHIIKNTLDNSMSCCSRLYLVGHTIDSDIHWLRQAGIEFPDLRVCDIGRAYRTITSPTKYSDMTGMEKILSTFGMDVRYLHNGGNDAHYNLEVLKKLMDLESPLTAAGWSL